ncbi:MAG: outer membrane protein assembly factor BamD [Bauldia sp.]
MSLALSTTPGPRRNPLSVVISVAALAGALVLAGCAGNDDEFVMEPIRPATDLYAEGIALMEAGDIGDALDTFRTLDRQYPYSANAREGLAIVAFAEYERGRYEEAEEAADRYLLLYNNTPEAAGMLHVKAESLLRQVPDITRSQDVAREALLVDLELVERFPNSEYAEQARLNIIAINDQLAGQEMLVGRYYLERREYVAAVNRFRVVVDEYETTRHVEEALFRLTETYLAMGLAGEAQAATALLGANFPQSRWYADAYQLLARAGLQAGAVAPG